MSVVALIPASKGADALCLVFDSLVDPKISEDSLDDRPTTGRSDAVSS